MDSYADARDQGVLMQDKCSFAMLRRILRGTCDLVFTDHERFILCHSAATPPVWIWTPDRISDTEKENAWQTASRVRPLAKGFRYNLKHELAEYFISRAREEGITAGISTNLFAYDCPAPIVPARAADGTLHCCAEDDIDEAASFIRQFHAELGGAVPDMAACREKAAQYISSSTFFLWRNAAGRAVACCSYRPDEELAALGSVYTVPEFRRQHYAQNMVYQVTQLVAGMGMLPMLYTDADYIASNACYKKIGYVLRGSLCTIAAR